MQENALKVLLIEDNPGDAFLMKFYLGESTAPVFETLHAETIKQAYELLEQHTFDIILQDLNLPDSHGIDSIKNLLERFPGNLVLVLTGLTDEEVGLETVRYGAQDFLVKGRFDGKVLISSVMFAYERFKLNKQIDKYEEEIDERKTRFDNLQKLLNVGYLEINKSDDKVFFSTNGKRLLDLDEKGNFFNTKSFASLFLNKAEILVAIDSNASSFDLVSPTGRKAMINANENEGKLLGVLRAV
jgi:DNA-binding response OmpR family regulator